VKLGVPRAFARLVANSNEETFVNRFLLPALVFSLACITVPAGAQTGDGAPAARGNASNPKISLILSSQYADYSSDAEPDVPGIVLGPETEFAPGGFSLGESELVLESNIDDQWHGWTTIALENEDGETVVAVEEAYVNTLDLPAGLAVKLGRFKSEIGYHNRIHAHAWEFVDEPLAYRALLAGGLQDDGVQLRWVAPADLLVEIGAEGFRGAAYPGGGDDRTGLKSVAAFVHIGGDIGSGGAWRLGVSHLRTDADGRTTGEDLPTVFTGDSDVSIVDVVYKWAPDGNPGYRNFVFNAEVLRREEDGDLVYDPDGTADASTYEGTQAGYYVQAIYQFMPRWRVGLRHDALSADNDVANPAAGTPLETLADDGADPTRDSVMMDFSNSEFSRIRLQYNRDESRPGDEKDDQFFVQFVYSLGAHPAHQF
jgi:hypothetical protein